MVQHLPGLAYGSDPRQELDLFLPEKHGPRLFVFIHGGGWRGGDKSHYHALGELLAGFGYAVALPNHRLAPEHPYPAAIEDVAAAIACVLRYAPESGIRTEGMYLGGHSSGAHLAALLAVHPRYRPEGEVAGVICISGVYELSAYAAAEDYLGPVFGDDPGVWADASPLRHLHPGVPPFFLAHAEFDYPGAGAQAAAMARGVKAVGGSAQVTEVPGRDHVTILTGVQSILDPLAMGLALFLRSAQ
ncbi:MAG TPA: alpha/beta hydrolase [Terriglobales bacterium]|nr:alpha/beta hydrolase [Terriglobales bacterium]